MGRGIGRHTPVGSSSPAKRPSLYEGLQRCRQASRRSNNPGRLAKKQQEGVREGKNGGEIDPTAPPPHVLLRPSAGLPAPPPPRYQRAKEGGRGERRTEARCTEASDGGRGADPVPLK
jgi:hypothetical protein